MPLGKASTVSTDERRQMLEQELESLRIQWRYMPVERATVRNVLRCAFEHKEKMQRIDNKELSRIEDDLAPASSSSNKKKDATNYLEIGTLRKAQLTFSEVNGNERNQLSALDAQILEMEEAIDQQRKKNGSASIASHANKIKRVRVYENRLNTATVAFNKLLAENNDLRIKIEHFRKQRGVFNTLSKRLKTRSINLKKQINDVVHMATSVYNARDDSHSKMINLINRNDSDYKAFIGEEKEMTRIIAQETKLQEFMKTKNNEKSELAYKEAMMRHQSLENRAEHQQEQEMIKFEQVLSSIINILDETQGQDLLSILRSPVNANNKVNEMTTAIKPVCDKYKKTEEQNFSLFQFVNEISHDVKKLKEKISKLEKEREAKKAESLNKKADRSQEKSKKKADLQNHNEEVSQREQRLRSCLENFQTIKNRVENVFNKLACSDSNLKSLLDNNTAVTLSNLDIFLSEIERTIDSLTEIEASNRIQNEDGENSKSGTPVPNSRRTASRSAARDGNKNNKNNDDKNNKDNNTAQSQRNDNDPKVTAEIIDQQYNDLDEVLMNIDDLRDRTNYLMNERVRSAKTPKTPKSRGV